MLQAANIISGDLRAHAKIPVPKLQPRPNATDGRVDCVFPETVHEERTQLAQWMAEARETFQRGGADPLPTAAVILRSRSAMPAISAALTEAGVPNRIVGLGGLLSTPEVTDVVSVLRCLWYADAGSDLIRILAGPRFRVGVADLAGLRDAARWFSQRDVSQQRLQDEDREADSVLPDPDRQFTLIDALDAIASMSDLGHRALASISMTGRQRLQQAGLMLRSLRRGVGGDISELIGSVVFALRLDIELEANETKFEQGSGSALANIEAFTDLAEGFLAIDTVGTLAALLEWIERAAEDDDAPEHVPAPLPGTVQLITAHGAKGLQWDLVAVPRLVNDEFPGKPRSGKGWLTTGALPDELRGDRNARPQLNWCIATTQKELRDRIAEYRGALQERHADEERRLAYVAVTRSAGWLFLSGSFWGGQKRPRNPSIYLTELTEGESPVIPELPLASMYEEDPSETLELTANWPLDPLGRRSDAVLRAAKVIREEIERSSQVNKPGGSHTDQVVELLLAERNAQIEGDGSRALQSKLPERVTASTFHEFVEDPVQAELRRLRPIPQRPYRRTRVGNQFHEWVERRSTTAGGTVLPLAGLDPEEWGIDPHEFDGEADLRPLIDAFERSRWSSLQPVAVELEVSLPFAGRTLVCKLDAVYRVEGTTERFEVVDWKSGRAPANEAERVSRFFQLDLYRHAYALWANISPDLIDVSLFYVAEEVELRGESNRSLAELEAVWLEAAESLRNEVDGGDHSHL
ncbi:3'-5' exonuclease [Leucobacter denitrificans]|uniref:3'-5' exonuclease n=1 Tax=Leucobacter denitrificans TaxID=683042 RepID=UPI001FED277E|nr:3'-5' exonuclease [Leucobacter denitrificans]